MYQPDPFGTFGDIFEVTQTHNRVTWRKRRYSRASVIRNTELGWDNSRKRLILKRQPHLCPCLVNSYSTTICDVRQHTFDKTMEAAAEVNKVYFEYVSYFTDLIRRGCTPFPDLVVLRPR